MTSAIIQELLRKYKNWKDAPQRAPVSLANIWAVVQSWFRRSYKVPRHIEEQVEYRKTLANPICVSTNNCFCGCQFDELIFSDKSCVNNCYPDMMDRKTWNKFKKNDKRKS